MIRFLHKNLKIPLLWGFVYGGIAPFIFLYLAFSYSPYAFFYLPIVALMYPGFWTARFMDVFLLEPHYAKGLWCADFKMIWWCTKEPLIIFFLLNGFLWVAIFFLLSWLVKHDARFLGRRSWRARKEVERGSRDLPLPLLRKEGTINGLFSPYEGEIKRGLPFFHDSNL